jgi:hypothetical protein
MTLDILKSLKQKTRAKNIDFFFNVKKTLFDQNFSLIKVKFGRFFVEKISPKWRNFAQSGHPD